MKKLIQKITLVVCIFVIAACATHGKNFDINAIDSLAPGETTIQEAIAKLGKPVTKSKLANGETILGWNYIIASPVGAKSRFAQIKFSADGKMQQVLSRIEQEN